MEHEGGISLSNVDTNQLTFLLLNILSQLSHSKKGNSLRSLFERIDEKKTGAVTL